MAIDFDNIVKTTNTTPYVQVEAFLICGVPIGIGSSCTIGTNGALSAFTAFQSTYNTGIYLYFSSGAFNSTSIAGFYFCIMSSTTAGIAYSNMYDPATNINPTIPQSALRIPIVGSGSAYTQITTAVTCLQKTKTNGMFGLNSIIHIIGIQQNNNSATTKLALAKIAGTTIFSMANTTNNIYQLLSCMFSRGVNNAQTISRLGSGLSSGSGSNTTNTAIDMSIDQQLIVTLSIAAATDTIVLEGFSCELKSV